MDINEVTQEQLDTLQAEREELAKFKDESAAKLAEYETKKAEWEAKEREFQEQVNPNWQRARKSMDAMRSALKEKGVEVDDDGNVRGNPNGITIEQARQEAAQAARNEMLGGRLQELLGEYDAESAPVIKHYYDKLTAGEEVSLQNVRKFVQQAETVARSSTSNPISRVASFSGGSGPRIPSNEEKLDETTATELGQKMGLSFVNKK